MKKIKFFIKKITIAVLKLQSKINPANDKLGHFYWGFFYAYITDLFTDNLLIVGIPLFFALSKELGDSMGLGKVEKLDVFFTILAGVLIYIRQFI